MLKIVNRIKQLLCQNKELEYITSKFNEYNERYFNGELPKIPLTIDNTLGNVWGRFESVTDILNHSWRPKQILLNMQNLQDEQVLRNVFVHEMTHYWDCITNQPTNEQWEKVNKMQKNFYPIILANAGNKYLRIVYWQSVYLILGLHFEDDHSPKFKEKCHELNEKFTELHLSEQVDGPRL